jgi:hypothetical protein
MNSSIQTTVAPGGRRVARAAVTILEDYEEEPVEGQESVLR